MKRTLTPNGYISLSVPVHNTREEHRAVWIEANGVIPKGMQIHHINGKKDDNRLANLALVTHKENHQKMDLAGKGYRIINGSKVRPYNARRGINGTTKNLGQFGTPCGAYMAHRMAYITQ